jgi:prepilin-type processing-associated H-X9-DG protein
MQEEFVGYLLNALDPVTHRRVERYLAEHPESEEQLEALRQSLAPLEALAEEDAPPPGLASRTLEFVAAETCLRLPQAPPETSRSGGPGRAVWRRADVMVAASIVVFVLLLTPPVLSQVRREYQKVACKNNLGVLGRAQLAYCGTHKGKFPNVAEEKPPYNVAGMVVPILYEAGVLDPEFDFQCPGDEAGDPVKWTAGKLKGLPVGQYLDKVKFLSGAYAYSLGYRQDGSVLGLRMDDEQPQAHTPLMADAPFKPLSHANSGNHGGSGQNVLYMDGHVTYCTHRLVGYQQDDIFQSRDNKIGAGINRYDAVLGQSDSCP